MIDGKQVGSSESYKSRTIVVTSFCLDYKAYVDGKQVGQAWTTPVTAKNAARRHIDADEEEQRRQSRGR